VQRNLLPQQVVGILGLELDAFSRPAQIVGGDYYDYFEYQNGMNGVAIADVAGHGVSASLLMASVQTLLRTLVPENDSPAEVMRQMHHLYRYNIRFTTFVTLFMGTFDPTDHTFSYCNAGHIPPIVLRKTPEEGPEVLWLSPTGPAIGLVEEADFGDETIALFPGDLLVMYTDGITEAINPANEEFGRERLATLIQVYRHLPVNDIIQKVRQALREFTAGIPLADDTTILICRIDET
jgi:sigma-B regulation protein RsbU (phosphoserine phosphatase)